MEECSPHVREHAVQVCRDLCAERSIGPEDFRSCVEGCVEEIKRRCYQA